MFIRRYTLKNYDKNNINKNKTNKNSILYRKLPFSYIEEWNELHLTLAYLFYYIQSVIRQIAHSSLPFETYSEEPFPCQKMIYQQNVTLRVFY